MLYVIKFTLSVTLIFFTSVYLVTLSNQAFFLKSMTFSVAHKVNRE